MYSFALADSSMTFVLIYSEVKNDDRGCFSLLDVSDVSTVGNFRLRLDSTCFPSDVSLWLFLSVMSVLFS